MFLARIPWKWWCVLLYYIREHMLSVCSITKHSVLKLFLDWYELWHAYAGTPTAGTAVTSRQHPVQSGWPESPPSSLSFATSLSGPLGFPPAIITPPSSKSHPLAGRSEPGTLSSIQSACLQCFRSFKLGSLALARLGFGGKSCSWIRGRTRCPCVRWNQIQVDFTFNHGPPG